MFSVLIIEPNRDERLREDALEVQRIREPVTREGQVIQEKGLLIQWSDGCSTHWGEVASPAEQRTFHVMNRHGSTVATYHV